MNSPGLTGTEPCIVTIYSSSGKARANLNYVADFEARTGVLGKDGVVATFRWLGDSEIRLEHLDLDLVFEVDMAGVVESPHPVTGVARRPWGSLDRRMHALIRAVVEYTEGLVALARDTRAKRRVFRTQYLQRIRRFNVAAPSPRSRAT